MCGEGVFTTEHYSQKFVENVNDVIKRYHGKLVEELQVKFEFDRKFIQHLDDWVNFALSSRAKSLAFDLVPAKFGSRHDHYRFPFDLFDAKSMSRRQRMQLSFVSLESISLSPFNGFLNLKKLDLHAVRATQRDLQNMLSNCSNLDWLSIVRCHLHDELKVVHPLPRLLHLHVAHCNITKIEFCAENLQIFEYSGRKLPIYLGHSSELKDARLYFIAEFTLDDALIALPNLLPRVQNLTLRTYMSLKRPWLLGNSLKFSQLKDVKLSFFVESGDLSNILSLVSFLSAAPFMEKLEIDFSVSAYPNCSELIRRLPRCRHNHLKNLYITGFGGCTGQVEFLVNVVENAPNLEVLTIDRADCYSIDKEDDRRTRFKAMDIARRHLDGRVSENTKVYIK